MTDFAYDLLVLGAGSRGLATSKRAASYGARVAIIENDRVGGTCVIRGCVPKKFMVYAAEFAHAFEDARGYGWSSEGVSVDWAELVARRDANVASLEATHERLLREAGVELLRGRGRITGPNTVDLDGRTISAKTILVATGSRPVVPEIEGIEHVITSDGFFELKQQPREVAVIGAGYIACELAGVLQNMGTQVHLIYRGDLPLRGFDCDLRRELDSAMRASGMQVHEKTVVRRIRKVETGFALELTGPDGECLLGVERCMLYATGRRANTEGLGLEAVGVGLDEEEARLVYGDEAVTIYRARFRPMLHNLSGRASFTTVKLVVRKDDDRVLGCHLIGKDAPEIIQGFAVAVKMGATKRDFDATVGIHPTTAEELVTLR